MHVASFDTQGRDEFLRASDIHHVTVRALQALLAARGGNGETNLDQWCTEALQRERQRISNAIARLEPVCNALEAAGCPVVVIKSLDHWPDLGSDLDLYTSGDPDTVSRTMAQQFQATEEPRSWGDRLANKWNFSVPGLPELIEIHVRYLGQTGEHEAIGQRLIDRSRTRIVLGHTFRVAAPEERVVISTLQRMYRHFYFRLCDMVDTADLVERNEIDFGQLRRTADLGNVWPGVASYLLLVKNYANQYGRRLALPREVEQDAYAPDANVYLRGNFLRVPMLPAAGLYGSQLIGASKRGDMRAVLRLPLLPPLALSALVAYRVTGTDKGIW
jgi:hypothetical protein